ncbi:MAG: hypothetical protein V8Q79_02250 [Christensenellales bacterium]
MTAADGGVVEGKINVGAGGEGSKAELTNSGEANLRLPATRMKAARRA